MMLNNSACDDDTALEVLQFQNNWCDTLWGHSLDGLIGAECSSGRYVCLQYIYGLQASSLWICR